MGRATLKAIKMPDTKPRTSYLLTAFLTSFSIFLPPLASSWLTYASSVTRESFPLASRASTVRSGHQEQEPSELVMRSLNTAFQRKMWAKPSRQRLNLNFDHAGPTEFVITSSRPNHTHASHFKPTSMRALRQSQSSCHITFSYVDPIKIQCPTLPKSNFTLTIWRIWTTKTPTRPLSKANSGP